MLETIYWTTLIPDCFDITKMSQLCELSLRKRILRILIKPEHLETSMILRSRSQARHAIYIAINNVGQKKPGSSKFMGMPADCFDAEGFELSPIQTTDPSVLIKDMIDCTNFLKAQLHTTIPVGWDLRECKLKENDLLKFFEILVNSVKPTYIRFGQNQGLIASLAKKMCSVAVSIPYDADVESEFKSISVVDILKLEKQLSTKKE